MNNDVYAIDENLDGTIDYSFENPDFSYVQFNSNLVLRWEYIPGSELFLVWSQGVTARRFNDRMDLFEGFEAGSFRPTPSEYFLTESHLSVYFVSK